MGGDYGDDWSGCHRDVRKRGEGVRGGSLLGRNGFVVRTGRWRCTAEVEKLWLLHRQGLERIWYKGLVVADGCDTFLSAESRTKRKIRTMLVYRTLYALMQINVDNRISKNL